MFWIPKSIIITDLTCTISYQCRRRAVWNPVVYGVPCVWLMAGYDMTKILFSYILHFIWWLQKIYFIALSIYMIRNYFVDIIHSKKMDVFWVLIFFFSKCEHFKNIYNFCLNCYTFCGQGNGLSENRGFYYIKTQDNNVESSSP